MDNNDYFPKEDEVNKLNYGFGVDGNRMKDTLEDVPGWEKGTVQVPFHPKSRLAGQQGIHIPDPDIIAAREPYRIGRFIWKWLKYPPFFADPAKDLMRFLFEDCVKGISGLPNSNYDTFQTTNGATRYNITYPGMYKENSSDVSLKVPEFAGSPVRKILDYWISGISDRKSAVTHFYGKKLRAVLPNMSASGLYIVLGPTCRPEDIEFSCIWHEMIPTVGEKLDQYNAELGEHNGGQDFDCSFSGIFDRNAEIDALARKVVESYALYGEGFWNARLPKYITDNFGAVDGSSPVTLEGRVKQSNEDGLTDASFTPSAGIPVIN